jgi:enoyl reductase-like protein
MALDTKAIANGAVTATQIKAAYEPLNNKTDMFEYCVIDFLNNILELAGIDDEPSFTRSMIVNTNEEIGVIMQSAEYLSMDYVTEKIMTMLGDADRVQDVLEEMDNENTARMPIGTGVDDGSGTQTNGSGVEGTGEQDFQ